MADFYEAVELALSADSVRSPNAWVTASKICARKRPRLIPVRDRQVRDYLGLSKLTDYQIDWQVFRDLAADADIITALSMITDATVAASTGRNLRMDSSPLRLLDAAIWTMPLPRHELQRWDVTGLADAPGYPTLAKGTDELVSTVTLSRRDPGSRSAR